VRSEERKAARERKIDALSIRDDFTPVVK